METWRLLSCGALLALAVAAHSAVKRQEAAPPPASINAGDPIDQFTKQPFHHPVLANGQDDAPGLQERIDEAKAHRTPLIFPPGRYTVMESLDVTNSLGFKVEGAGKLETVIVSALRDPYPTVDLTGSLKVRLVDFSIQTSKIPNQVDNATCGILVAREGSTPSGPDGKPDPKHNHPGYGDEASLENIQVEMLGPRAVAAVVNVSADLMMSTNCVYIGPIGLVVDCFNLKNIQSAYQPMTHDKDMIDSTIQTMRNGECRGMKSAGIEYGNGGALALYDVFFRVGEPGVKGLSAVKVVGSPNSGDHIYMYNCRSECPNKDSVPSYVVDFALDPLPNGKVAGGSSGGQIQGDFHCYLGPYIRLHKGLTLRNYIFQMRIYPKDDNGNPLAMVSGDSDDDLGEINYSTFFNEGDIPIRISRKSTGDVVLGPHGGSN